MTPPQQHPQRCETCENGKMRPENGSARCKGRYLTPSEVTLISKIGCASHSSAQDRIDAVIKELEQRVKNAQILGGYPMMSVYEVIALLQAGEKK